VGVSWNKAFAKLGSDYKKPNATTVIDQNNWRDIVFPLPVGDLLMVGHKTEQALVKYGITTIGRLAACEREWLVSMFGKFGDVLYNNSNGLDDSRVAIAGHHTPLKSISNGQTFRHDLVSTKDITAAIYYIADVVATRLRKNKFKCTTVGLFIKDPSFETISRQHVVQATQSSNDLAHHCLRILSENWTAGKPIRALTIFAGNFVHESDIVAEQLSIDDIDFKKLDIKQSKLVDHTLDKIRKKHGNSSIITAINMSSDIGTRPPSQGSSFGVSKDKVDE
jgi:DNA polymerase-4